jgi:hypothetical protein
VVILSETNQDQIVKKVFLATLAVGTLLLFNSCGISSALVINDNQNSTQVQLTTNNYRVIERITGSAEVEYVFLIGGMGQRQLYENAYSAMLQKANMTGGSRAIINVMTEENVSGFFPFFHTRTITVSAYVIEFTR